MTEYAGFGDPGMVASWLDTVAGRRLEAVIEARHWFEGRRDPDAASLIHAWLSFEGCAPTGLHVRGDRLLLARDEPYAAYDMDEYGETRVGPARDPDLLARFVGSRLAEGAVITGPDGGSACAGLRLRFDDGELVIGALADDWFLAGGPVAPALPPDWTVLER